MLNRRVVHAVPVILLALFIESTASAAAPTTQPSYGLPLSPGIQSRLDQRLPEFQFDGVAFSSVLDFIHNATGMKIDVEWEVLEAAGINKGTPVAVRLFNVKASQALEVTLDSVSPARKLHSEVDFADDKLVITTRDDYVARNTQDQGYDVSGLIRRWQGRRGGSDAHLYDVLSKLLKDSVARGSWVDCGGKPGVIKVKEGRLIIIQTRENHAKIESALFQINEAYRPAPLGQRPADSQIFWQLDRRLPEVTFDDLAFSSALDFLHDATGMKIDVNWEALKSAGIARNDRVNVRLLNVKARKAIDVIVDCVSTQQAGLHSQIDLAKDQFVITTYDDYVARNTEDREYDIHDLIGDASDPKASDRVTDLSQLISETVAPDSWVATGGKPGVIKAKDGRLTITQTRESHQQIENLMAQLRETRAQTSRQQQSNGSTQPAGPGTRGTP
jgi:hypothetical protein